MKTNRSHVAFLDQLRGFAIVWVFLYHSLGAAFGFVAMDWGGMTRDPNVSPAFLALLPVQFGYLGVAVFFVVSGFCIHLSHARSSDQSLKTFIVRRFFRIYPPYLLCVILLSLHHFYSFTQLGAHLALVQNFSQRTLYGINPSFWSIAVEVQLYALYPLFLIYAKKDGWRAVLAVTAAIEFGGRLLPIVFPTLPVSPTLASGNTLEFLFSWTLGAALADGYLRGTLARVPVRVLWAVAYLTVCTYFFRYAFSFTFPLAAILTAGVSCNLILDEATPPPRDCFFPRSAELAQ